MAKNSDPSVLSTASAVVETKTPLKSQVQREKDAYNASQISDSTTLPTPYQSNDVSGKLEELSGAVANTPPRLGEGYKSFKGGLVSGQLDWGVLKQADSDVWDRSSTLTSSEYLNEGSASFPYRRNFFPSLTDGADPRTDSVFNTSEGASHLSHYFHGQLQTFQPCRALGVDSASPLNGFEVSGFLYPADRGVVALLRWTNSQGWIGQPASTREEIMERCLAAILLGQGVESNADGEAGGALFTEGVGNAFPSRASGQYDLGELQRAQYRVDDPNRAVDPIPNLVENRQLGAVRLLKDGRAITDPFFIGSKVHQGGNLPVLFGSSLWNHDEAQYNFYTGDPAQVPAQGVILDANNPDKSFLSFRMPARASYSAESFSEDFAREERARFFRTAALNPSASAFNEAGGYVGFDVDAPQYQVARFKQFVPWTSIEAGLAALVSLVESTDDSDGIDLGSFALVHFKTEDAFERLVRDGIAPAQEDLWSFSPVKAAPFVEPVERYLNLGRYFTQGNNTSNDPSYTDPVGSFDLRGEPTPTEQFIDALGSSSARSNIVLVNGSATRQKKNHSEFNLYHNVDYKIENQYNGAAIEQDKFAYNARYAVISGVYYLLPKTQRIYDGHNNPLNLADILDEDDLTAESSSSSFSINSIRFFEGGVNVTDGGNNALWSTPFYGGQDLMSAGTFKTPIKTPPVFQLLTNQFTANNRVELSSRGEFGTQVIDSFATINNGSIDLDVKTLDTVSQVTLSPNMINVQVINTPALQWSVWRLDPAGDRGSDPRPPVFTQKLGLTVTAANPIDHEETLPYERVFSTAENNESLVDNFDFQEESWLYHSAYMKSLLTDADLITVDVAISYSQPAAVSNEMAFTLYRQGADNSAMVVEVELVDGSLEICSGSANTLGSGGTYAFNRPIYRPANAAGHANAGQAVSFRFTAVRHRPTFLEGQWKTAAIQNVLYDAYFFNLEDTNNLVNATISVAYSLDGGNTFTPYSPLNGQDTEERGVVFKDDNILNAAVIEVVKKHDPTTDYPVNMMWKTYGGGAIQGLEEAGAFGIEIYPSNDPADIPSAYGNFGESETGSVLMFTNTPVLYTSDPDGAGGNPNFPYLASSYTNGGNGGLVVRKPYKPYSRGFTAKKDTQERFLDEMYRMKSYITGFDESLSDVIFSTQTITASTLLHSGNFVVYDTDPNDIFYGDPVRFNPLGSHELQVRDEGDVFSSFNPPVRATPPHRDSGFVRNGYNAVMHYPHVTTLPEAQVAGLPFLTNATGHSAFPSLSRGRLIIPTEDYSSAVYTPSLGGGDLVPQADFTEAPDYLARFRNFATGTTYDQAGTNHSWLYTRAFDLAFSRSGTVEVVDGQSFVTLRLIGVHFDNLSRTITPALGVIENLETIQTAHASLDDNNDPTRPIGVLVQVPYVTRWLNVALADNQSGKSGNLDALRCLGCMVSYKDGYLTKENVKCVDIRINVAPHAFYTNSLGEVPLLVRVVLSKSTAYDAGGFDFAPKAPQDESTPYRDLTGLVGIEVLRESTGYNYDEDEVTPV